MQFHQSLCVCSCISSARTDFASEITGSPEKHKTCLSLSLHLPTDALATLKGQPVRDSFRNHSEFMHFNTSDRCQSAAVIILLMLCSHLQPLGAPWKRALGVTPGVSERPRLLYDATLQAHLRQLLPQTWDQVPCNRKLCGDCGPEHGPTVSVYVGKRYDPVSLKRKIHHSFILSLNSHLRL